MIAWSRYFLQRCDSFFHQLNGKVSSFVSNNLNRKFLLLLEFFFKEKWNWLLTIAFLAKPIGASSNPFVQKKSFLSEISNNATYSIGRCISFLRKTWGAVSVALYCIEVKKAQYICIELTSYIGSAKKYICLCSYITVFVNTSVQEVPSSFGPHETTFRLFWPS